MSTDRERILGFADEIDDIAVPEVSEFEDRAFQHYAKFVIGELEKLSAGCRLLGQAENGDTHLQAVGDTERDEAKDYARTPHQNPVTGWSHLESGASMGPDTPDEFGDAYSGQHPDEEEGEYASTPETLPGGADFSAETENPDFPLEAFEDKATIIEKWQEPPVEKVASKWPKPPAYPSGGVGAPPIDEWEAMYGKPDVDFDPEKEPYRLHPSHEDYVSF